MRPWDSSISERFPRSASSTVACTISAGGDGPWRRDCRGTSRSPSRHSSPEDGGSRSAQLLKSEEPPTLPSAALPSLPSSLGLLPLQQVHEGREGQQEAHGEQREGHEIDLHHVHRLAAPHPAE